MHWVLKTEIYLISFVEYFKREGLGEVAGWLVVVEETITDNLYF